MIVESPTAITLLLRRHWTVIPAVLIILIIVEIANDYVRFDRPAFSLAAVGLLISALSIFLAFRINEAYSRWWSARILWGDLVNSSRDFAQLAITLIDVTAAGKGEVPSDSRELKRELVYRQIAFLNALRLSLRKEDNWDELRPFVGDEEYASLLRAVNKPVRILQLQREGLAVAGRHGWLSDAASNQFDRAMKVIQNALGGCERIKNTPFPVNVSQVTRAIAWGMAIVVPVAITDQSNRFELVDMVIVPFFMLSFVLVERLGVELRDPFENEPNDTPMTSLCRVVERDLRQMLGEEALPPEIEIRKGVLM